MKLDILVFSAHPDDAELGCGGTIIKHVEQGFKLGIIDLTRGELGTRGNSEIRKKESELSSQIMGLSVRENMDFKDGFFTNDDDHKIEIIKKIRKYQPTTILANAPSDRHPDHAKASSIIVESSFLSGLEKINTDQPIWRPSNLFHYIQFNSLQPSFVIDISKQMNKKLQAVKAFSSQFYNPNSKESNTVISSKDFLESVTYRAKDLGRQTKCDFAEGFISNELIKLNDFSSLV